MTDKDIIQALECCANLGECSECPYGSITVCHEEKDKDVLDLINRQQADIERLNKVKHLLEETLEYKSRIIEAQTKVVRGLNLNNDQIKAEAIKEFWSRLQGIAYQSECEWSHGEHPMVIELNDAEEIYDEMVGEDK